MTDIVPGQESHHSGEDADKIEQGVCHLVLEDPVWIGGRVAGNTGGAVSECHDEVE